MKRVFHFARALFMSCALLISSGVLAEDGSDPAPPNAARAPSGTRVASKIAVYKDNDGLSVITPIISVTQTFRDTTTVQAEYDVDVLTAATVDVRTSATPKFSEVRHGAELSVTQRVRSWDMDLTGSFSVSREADYASATFSTGFASDLLEKNVTVGGGYSYVANAVGRSRTPYGNFADSLQIHAFSASFTQLLSKDAYVQFSTSLIGAFGYQGSVYRYVPMFLEGQVDPRKVDETTLLDGDVRPLLRPAEQVPRTRYRAAFVTRLNKAFPIGLTIVPDYRFYLDNWGLLSHTFDLAAYQHLPYGFVLRVRNRFYYQSAASFYQRVYMISSAEDLPEFYTTDRELGTFWYDLVGVKLSFEIPGIGFIDRVVIDAKADWQYTRYDDFAFLPERKALVLGGGLLFEL